MAVLSKIRQRSFFLIIIIALALFSFVLADVIQSGTFSSDANNVGSVNGTDIDAQQFMQNVAMIEKQGQGTTSTQALNSAWDQEVRRIILTEEFEKLGLKVGSEQLINVIKQNPNLAQNPQFLNAAGQFDENKFKESLKGIKNAPDQTQWLQWKEFEKNIERYAVEQMYNTMIKSGVYTTKAEGKFQYKLENDKANFDYVTVAFSTVNDDQVKVTDAEIIDFMKKSPKKYKSDNTTSVDFVLVENKPSKEDEQAMLSSIGDVKVKFDSVANVGEFVNANSDIKFDSTYVTKKDLPIDYQEQLFNLPVGGVFGPYVFNGHQCISRMIAKKGNASAKASHILLAYKGAPQSTATRTKEEAQALANDLLAQVKANPGNFVMLAMANSDDPGSKNNGGEYDNITPGQMVPQFNDYVFNNPVGSIGVVETDFGFHVIKVTAKYDAVLMGTVAQKIQPSEATIDAIYTKASQLEADANENKDFAAIAKKAGFEVVPATNLKGSDEYVQGIGSQREIVRWSFNKDTEIGDVRRFEVPQGFVIAKLKDRNESGLLPIDIAKLQVEPIIKNQKKAEIIKKKMSGSSLEAVAKASGASVQIAAGVSLKAPVIPNIGNEPKVVGKAFGLTPGKTSEIIEGTSGMFMVRAKAVTKAPEVPSYETYITQDRSQNRSYAISMSYIALKDKAEIKDNRANF
ncbi:peptidyl-prolyl cis-trans isomerase D [Flavobacterium aquaticum]|jgi:peptidyl-prolyl cis-trans isomerase D|uniref:Periplasmic chaperone PpiD n=1 Tax=Flavobacterium aquaticum TaxID=1236486 RepID=A0A327YJ50_9FLAO|nr:MULTISPECIES: peptidylprolyl isomerase [Flavobacterium]MCK6606782.1 peptidylprolyl isomerase [Flavobacterium sp.]RAK20990.1 peptidyl-prolyl cis-trans isomerase D [Flavobacterium aquaticum]